MNASPLPADVQEILARKDAQIAAARKVREGLSGQRIWKTPMGAHQSKPGHATWDREREARRATRAEPRWMTLLRVALVTVPAEINSLAAAAILVTSPGDASCVLADLRKNLDRAGVAYHHTPGLGGSATRAKPAVVRVLNLEAARAVLK